MGSNLWRKRKRVCGTIGIKGKELIDGVFEIYRKSEEILSIAEGEDLLVDKGDRSRLAGNIREKGLREFYRRRIRLANIHNNIYWGCIGTAEGYREGSGILAPGAQGLQPPRNPCAS